MKPLLFILILLTLSCTVTKPKAAATPTPVPVTVASEELAAAYRENEVGADAKYKDRTLTVSGRLNEVVDAGDTLHLELWGGKTAIDVRCFFPDRKQIDHIAELKSGDAVTVSGENLGLMDNAFIALSRCSIK